MIEDIVVIDGVAHGADLSVRNWRNPAVCEPFAHNAYVGVMQLGVPKGRPEFSFDQAAYERGETAHPDVVESALFAESWTDMGVYHGVPMFGFLHEGLSPFRTGVELQRRLPHRVELFAPISPFEPDPIGMIDRYVEEYRIAGLKLYPVDQYGTEVKSYRMDDAELIYPILERAQHHGLSTVAVHKAIPLGRFPMEPFHVNDIDMAFHAFPDLNIEIVHGGMAFLDETAHQLRRFKNAWVNLEATSSFLVKAPGRFREILGSLMAAGGTDRIVWGTGCTTVHPQPLLEAFWELEFTDEMIDEYGIPPLTREVKAKILGENYARRHGIDLEAFKATAATDRYGLDGDLAEPWGPVTAGGLSAW